MATSLVIPFYLSFSTFRVGLVGRLRDCPFLDFKKKILLPLFEKKTKFALSDGVGFIKTENLIS